MALLTSSIIIRASIDRVFDAIADVDHAAERISGITKVERLTEGPIGLGTRFRETRTVFGREATEEMTFAEFNPPTQYTLIAESHGSRYTSTFRCREVEAEEADGRATEVTLEFNATPLTFAARCMSILMKPMLKSMCKAIETDLSDVKRWVEQNESAAVRIAGA